MYMLSSSYQNDDGSGNIALLVGVWRGRVCGHRLWKWFALLSTPQLFLLAALESSRATVNENLTFFRRGCAEDLVFVKGAAGICQWTVP